MRAGKIVAEGGARDVLTRENLEFLYGAKVVPVEDKSKIAFLPG